jgi:hypothetical protein
VALLPGSIDVKVWLRKSDEEGDPELVCERSVEGKVNWPSSKMVRMPPTVTKGEERKPFDSEGNNELPGAVQEAGYSDEEVEKGWTEGGGEADERESEVGLLSGGSPSIAVRMEYSKLAASEPKVKDGVLRGVLDKGSFAVKLSMTADKLLDDK